MGGLGVAHSQFLNASALYDTLTYAALTYGLDGMFIWGSGGRDCTANACAGNGTCSRADAQTGYCETDVSIGTYVNTLLGPAVQQAVTLATECATARCGGHGRCFGCSEPFGAAAWPGCKCDCDDEFPQCAGTADGLPAKSDDSAAHPPGQDSLLNISATRKVLRRARTPAMAFFPGGALDGGDVLALTAASHAGAGVPCETPVSFNAGVLQDGLHPVSVKTDDVKSDYNDNDDRMGPKF